MRLPGRSRRARRDRPQKAAPPHSPNRARKRPQFAELRALRARLRLRGSPAGTRATEIPGMCGRPAETPRPGLRAPLARGRVAAARGAVFPGEPFRGSLGSERESERESAARCHSESRGSLAEHLAGDLLARCCFRRLLRPGRCPKKRSAHRRGSLSLGLRGRRFSPAPPRAGGSRSRAPESCALAIRTGLQAALAARNAPTSGPLTHATSLDVLAAESAALPDAVHARLPSRSVPRPPRDIGALRTAVAPRGRMAEHHLVPRLGREVPVGGPVVDSPVSGHEVVPFPTWQAGLRGLD